MKNTATVVIMVLLLLLAGCSRMNPETGKIYKVLSEEGNSKGKELILRDVEIPNRIKRVILKCEGGGAGYYNDDCSIQEEDVVIATSYANGRWAIKKIGR